MDKGIGFNRNIKLEWLDAAAAFRTESDNLSEIRERLEMVVSQDRTGKEATRKSVDILINVWYKNYELAPALFEKALQFYETTQSPGDRLWLHYGLTMVYYPFFFECIATIGHLSRYEDSITNKTIIKQMTAQIGHMGSLERSVRRVIASLRDWGILVESERRYHYIPEIQQFTTSNRDIEAWLLQSALHSHPAEELPVDDLLHLAALFPFRFSLTTYDLRQYSTFQIQRQGLGMDMIRIDTSE